MAYYRRGLFITTDDKAFLYQDPESMAASAAVSALADATTGMLRVHNSKIHVTKQVNFNFLSFSSYVIVTRYLT